MGEWSSGRPVYKKVDGEEERFLLVNEGYSGWEISPGATSATSSWIGSGRATNSPLSPAAGPSLRRGWTSWVYADGGEVKEGEVTLKCIKQ